eukprot:GHVN01035059.1.p1 GENE.GHVN01035059.1~~GHVN01035059.1.p1  ORF type:complete len:2351 (-),score=272.17 GHVN01035059.1:2943-9995(-)
MNSAGECSRRASGSGDGSVRMVTRSRASTSRPAVNSQPSRKVSSYRRTKIGPFRSRSSFSQAGPRIAKTLNAQPAPENRWVQCALCDKWRFLPRCSDDDYKNLSSEGFVWKCAMNKWDATRASCDIAEENEAQYAHSGPTATNGELDESRDVEQTDFVSEGPVETIGVPKSVPQNFLEAINPKRPWSSASGKSSGGDCVPKEVKRNRTWKETGALPIEREDRTHFEKKSENDLLKTHKEPPEGRSILENPEPAAVERATNIETPPNKSPSRFDAHASDHHSEWGESKAFPAEPLHAQFSISAPSVGAHSESGVGESGETVNILPLSGRCVKSFASVESAAPPFWRDARESSFSLDGKQPTPSLSHQQMVITTSGPLSRVTTGGRGCTNSPLTNEVQDIQWVCCDKCQKWRQLPGVSHTLFETIRHKNYWECSMNDWDLKRSSCDAPEELYGHETDVHLSSHLHLDMKASTSFRHETEITSFSNGVYGPHPPPIMCRPNKRMKQQMRKPSRSNGWSPNRGSSRSSSAMMGPGGAPFGTVPEEINGGCENTRDSSTFGKTDGGPTSRISSTRRIFTDCRQNGQPRASKAFSSPPPKLLKFTALELSHVAFQSHPLRGRAFYYAAENGLPLQVIEENAGVARLVAVQQKRGPRSGPPGQSDSSVPVVIKVDLAARTSWPGVEELSSGSEGVSDYDEPTVALQLGEVHDLRTRLFKLHPTLQDQFSGSYVSPTVTGKEEPMKDSPTTTSRRGDSGTSDHRHAASRYSSCHTAPDYFADGRRRRTTPGRLRRRPPNQMFGPYRSVARDRSERRCLSSTLSRLQPAFRTAWELIERGDKPFRTVEVGNEKLGKMSEVMSRNATGVMSHCTVTHNIIQLHTKATGSDGEGRVESETTSDGPPHPVEEARHLTASKVATPSQSPKSLHSQSPTSTPSKGQLPPSCLPDASVSDGAVKVVSDVEQSNVNQTKRYNMKKGPSSPKAKGDAGADPGCENKEHGTLKQTTSSPPPSPPASPKVNKHEEGRQARTSPIPETEEADQPAESKTKSSPRSKHPRTPRRRTAPAEPVASPTRSHSPRDRDREAAVSDVDDDCGILPHMGSGWSIDQGAPVRRSVRTRNKITIATSQSHSSRKKPADETESTPRKSFLRNQPRRKSADSSLQAANQVGGEPTTPKGKGDDRNIKGAGEGDAACGGSLRSTQEEGVSTAVVGEANVSETKNCHSAANGDRHTRNDAGKRNEGSSTIKRHLDSTSPICESKDSNESAESDESPDRDITTPGSRGETTTEDSPRFQTVEFPRGYGRNEKHQSSPGVISKSPPNTKSPTGGPRSTSDRRVRNVATDGGIRTPKRSNGQRVDTPNDRGDKQDSKFDGTTTAYGEQDGTTVVEQSSPDRTSFRKAQNDFLDAGGDSEPDISTPASKKVRAKRNRLLWKPVKQHHKRGSGNMEKHSANNLPEAVSERDGRPVLTSSDSGGEGASDPVTHSKTEKNEKNTKDRGSNAEHKESSPQGAASQFTQRDASPTIVPRKRALAHFPAPSVTLDIGAKTEQPIRAAEAVSPQSRGGHSTSPLKRCPRSGGADTYQQGNEWKGKERGRGGRGGLHGEWEESGRKQGEGCDRSPNTLGSDRSLEESPSPLNRGWSMSDDGQHTSSKFDGVVGGSGAWGRRQRGCLTQPNDEPVTPGSSSPRSLQSRVGSARRSQNSPFVLASEAGDGGDMGYLGRSPVSAAYGSPCRGGEFDYDRMSFSPMPSVRFHPPRLGTRRFPSPTEGRRRRPTFHQPPPPTPLRFPPTIDPFTSTSAMSDQAYPPLYRPYPHPIPAGQQFAANDERGRGRVVGGSPPNPLRGGRRFDSAASGSRLLSPKARARYSPSLIRQSQSVRSPEMKSPMCHQQVGGRFQPFDWSRQGPPMGALSTATDNRRPHPPMGWQPHYDRSESMRSEDMANGNERGGSDGSREMPGLERERPRMAGERGRQRRERDNRQGLMGGSDRREWGHSNRAIGPREWDNVGDGPESGPVSPASHPFRGRDRDGPRESQRDRLIRRQRDVSPSQRSHSMGSEGVLRVFEGDEPIMDSIGVVEGDRFRRQQGTPLQRGRPRVLLARPFYEAPSQEMYGKGGWNQGGIGGGMRWYPSERDSESPAPPAEGWNGRRSKGSRNNEVISGDEGDDAHTGYDVGGKRQRNQDRPVGGFGDRPRRSHSSHSSSGSNHGLSPTSGGCRDEMRARFRQAEDRGSEAGGHTWHQKVAGQYQRLPPTRRFGHEHSRWGASSTTGTNTRLGRFSQSLQNSNYVPLGAKYGLTSSEGAHSTRGTQSRYPDQLGNAEDGNTGNEPHSTERCPSRAPSLVPMSPSLTANYGSHRSPPWPP